MHHILIILASSSGLRSSAPSPRPPRTARRISCVCWRSLPPPFLTGGSRGTRSCRSGPARGRRTLCSVGCIRPYLHQGDQKRLLVVTLEQIVDDLALPMFQFFVQIYNSRDCLILCFLGSFECFSLKEGEYFRGRVHGDSLLQQ